MITSCSGPWPSAAGVAGTCQAAANTRPRRPGRPGRGAVPQHRRRLDGDLRAAAADRRAPHAGGPGRARPPTTIWGACAASR